MRRTLASAALLIATCLCGQAQAQMLLDQATKSATQALTPEQRKAVAALVEKQASDFAAADAAGMVSLRNDMVKFLRDVTMKDPCRREYATEFVRAFRPFLSGEHRLRMLRASNVFIIARFAPTNDTMTMLLDNADPASQADPAMRIAASAQLAPAVKAAQFAGPQAEAIAKRAAALAKSETAWAAAAHDCEAIVEALRIKSLPPAQADAIAIQLGAAVNDVTANAFDGGQPDLVHAVQRALLAIRNQTSEAPASSRAKLFTAISGSLDKLAAMKGKPPEAFTGESRKLAFESTVNTADLLRKVRSAAK